MTVHGSTTSTSTSNTVPTLEGVVWKRRSGLGMLSETVGVGKSWERRRLILHAAEATTPSSSSKASLCKLCYYDLLEEDEAEAGTSCSISASASPTDQKQQQQHQQQQQPRGTLVLLSERATICASHLLHDTTQPTPYCLTIKTTDEHGISPEIIRWKLCFEDRKAQMSWLIALTDAIVEVSIGEFNANTLSAEADKYWGEHGGFHRLYEEGEEGMFDAVKDILMGDKGTKQDDNNDINSVVSVPSTPPPPPIATTTVVPPSSLPSSTTDASSTAKKEPTNGYFLAQHTFYQTLAVVNISIIYAHLAAVSTATASPASSSFLVVISWWQLLVAVNACIIYMCIVGPSSATNMTALMMNAELVRAAAAAEAVPVAKEEQEREPNLPEKKRSEKKQQQPRVEPLSEKEMETHRQEKWAMSAPGVDLSGAWTLIADAPFKVEYDTYLTTLGFNRLSRGVACSLISRTFEEIHQSEGGRVLYLNCTNPKGSWARTLRASGYPDSTGGEGGRDSQAPHLITQQQQQQHCLQTADDETVQAEAWWEERGTRHRSWLRGGGNKYGGGDFQSLRYLNDEGTILICHSTFHRRRNDDVTKYQENNVATVTWRFQRTR